MSEQSFYVGVEDTGRRIERFLASQLPNTAKGHIDKLLRQGRVQAEGNDAPLLLARGDRLGVCERVVILPPPAERPAPQPNRRLRFEVLHEDEHLAAVLKPPRVAMHPGPGHGTDTLLNALVARFPDLLDLGREREWGLVHRLDKDTSGVLVVARTPQAYDGLVRAFSERAVTKVYLALVKGQPPDEGEIDVAVGDQDAHTRYQVLETRGPVSQVRLEPSTGRTHQLRIHLSSLGTPVLADARYGAGLDDVTARLYLTRMALHATHLELDHPLTGERLKWERGLPKDLRRAWKRAGKLIA